MKIHLSVFRLMGWNNSAGGCQRI